MSLTRVALTRPVFILMVIFGLVLLGAISFTRLNQELLPSVTTPAVSVVTIYPGASPDDVERLVTKPIEDAVFGSPNVDFIQSSSAEGRSIVTIVFNDRADDRQVASDIERRVSAIRGTLPNDALQPSVLKIDFGSSVILNFAVSGNRSLDELLRLTNDTIKPRLEAQDGVGQVNVGGGQDRELQVQVNPQRLVAYNLTYEQVQGALLRENQSRPGGSLDRGDTTLNVRLFNQFRTVDDVLNTVVASVPTQVYVRDIATVVETNKRATTQAFYNGRPAVSIGVTKSSTANEVSTANNVKAEVERLRQSLPEGVQISLISDTSRFTKASIEGVEKTLVEAIVITGVVLLLFLHTARVTTIVLFAIPTSLLTTFLWMSILGFTLNVMSTLALVLVIGVLVDDSIVVIENIVRHLGLGETPLQAALNGRSEIGLAAIAITLVDVVIFLPVALLSGITGGIFRQFALVIVAAVLTSLFISFTLTPMLASRWLSQKSLKVQRPPLTVFGIVWRVIVVAGFCALGYAAVSLNWGAYPILAIVFLGILAAWVMFLGAFVIPAWDKGFEALEHVYRRMLKWALNPWYRWIPPVAAAASLVFALWLVAAGVVRSEFIPQSDGGLILLDTELPPGSSLSATRALHERIEQVLLATPEVDSVLAIAGGSTGGGTTGPRFGAIIVNLKPLNQRTRSSFQLSEIIRNQVDGLNGATVRVGTGGFGAGSPVSVRVQGQDRDQVATVAAQVEQIVRSIPGTQSVQNTAAVGSPEVRLTVDRQRAADFRVTADQVASALRTSVEGTTVGKFRPEGRTEMDIRLIASEATRRETASVLDVPITVLRDGQPVQARIGQLTRQEEVAGPASLNRRNRQPTATINAGLVDTTPLNDVTNPLNRQLAELRQTLPPGITVTLGGEAQQQAESFGALLGALALSIVLIYMLLAALYESFVMPFATMFALPVATVGAFLGLALSGTTLNLLSLIGFIVLMGLVGKNGILLVDYTNTLRARGRTRTEALLEAGPTRLRPIFMTSAALVFGLLPIALGFEEGSRLYTSIGWLIIGGMITSTVLSLIVVPTMYTYFDDLQNLIVKAWRWRPGRRGARSVERVGGVEQPAPQPVLRLAQTPEAE